MRERRGVERNLVVRVFYQVFERVSGALQELFQRRVFESAFVSSVPDCMFVLGGHQSLLFAFVAIEDYLLIRQVSWGESVRCECTENHLAERAFD